MITKYALVADKMDTNQNGNMNQQPKGCNNPKEVIFQPSYYNPPIPLSNNSSYRIIYMPKPGKIDVKAKEAILIASALLLLGFSLFQFYKKWVKHYRDINQGSFTSYYYKYNSGSLPVMNSPTLNRRDSARVNWKKLGAAVSVNARIRAIRARKQLEDARTNDPLLYDNISSNKSSSSFRRKSVPVKPRPTKWALVRTIVQPDEEENRINRNRKNASAESRYTSNKSIISCRDKVAQSRIKSALNKRSIQAGRERIKSRSLDDTASSKPFQSYIPPQNNFPHDENDVFTPPQLTSQNDVSNKRASVAFSLKSQSIYNGDISQTAYLGQEHDSENIIIEDRRKSEPLSHNISVSLETEEPNTGEKCKIQYIKENVVTNTSTKESYRIESKEETVSKGSYQEKGSKMLKTSDSWIKLPSTIDTSELV